MTKIYNDYKGKTRIGNIELFLEAVIDNFQTILKNEKKQDKLNKVSKIIKHPETGDSFEYRGYGHGDELYRLYRNIQKKSIQGIILLNTFFEAVINEIGVNYLGQKYYGENLDKLSLKSKWEIVLNLIYGKSIDKDKVYYENFIQLIKSRNKLIHYKTSILNEHTDLIKFEPREILGNNIDTLKLFIANLKEIDSEKEVLYFFEIENQLRRLK